MAFPCVCGGKRYLFPATPRERVSIYTNINGRSWGFLGNAESAESAGIFATVGKILRGCGAFLRPILPVFTMCPIRGGGPTPEGISVCLRLKAVSIPVDS